jgi:hypothetical protein
MSVQNINYGSGGDGNFVHDPAGLTGIGTPNPSATLDVNGLIRSTYTPFFPSSGIGVEISYYAPASGGVIEVWDRNINVAHTLFLQPSGGSIGINISTPPAATLDIGGSLHARGGVVFDSTLTVGGQLTVQSIQVLTAFVSGANLTVYGGISGQSLSVTGAAMLGTTSVSSLAVGPGGGGINADSANTVIGVPSGGYLYLCG